jgi:glycosyltransferase involved in cell wall biosynthesis
MKEMQSDRRTRIIFFDEAVAFGGSVVVLAHLLQHLDRREFLPMVVTSLDDIHVQQLFRPEDVLCRFRPLLNYSHRIRWMGRCPSLRTWFRRSWAYLFTVAAAITNLPQYLYLLFKVAKARPSLVHVNNGSEGFAAAKVLRIPFIVHLHGIGPDSLQGPYDIRSNAALFISISKYITSEAIKLGVASDRIVDLPNPAPTLVKREISDDQWRTKFSLPPNAIVIAHVGRLVRWKGQLEFLEAFSKVAQDNPNSYALIVGDDGEAFSSEYPRSLRELAAARKIETQVVFAGHVQNILELMAFADIVVHSSIVPEPFGLVITEAMSVGTAVIAANSGAPVEIVEHGVTGMLVDPTDPNQFAAIIANLLSDEKMRLRIAVAGQCVARERYSLEHYARRAGAIYGMVLASQDLSLKNSGDLF